MTLDAQAIELIGLAEKATEGRAQDKADFHLRAFHDAPAIARAYLEARAEIERLREPAEAIFKAVEANAAPINVMAALRGVSADGGRISLDCDLLADLFAALHPQPDTTSEVM